MFLAALGQPRVSHTCGPAVDRLRHTSAPSDTPSCANTHAHPLGQPTHTPQERPAARICTNNASTLTHIQPLSLVRMVNLA